MKRILINATHNEEIRVALCKGNHLYDFDLENRTREQKKSNIYKAHVTRVEPSLEAVFVEYGSQRQGFLPVREIAKEYLNGGNSRDDNIRNLIKEGDTLIVQVEKEERGNKGAALSTYISLAGRYLVLMPNNPKGGGISRQISGKMRDEMRTIVSNLTIPKGMSIIIRTAGIGKTQDDLQHDLDHLLSIWNAIGEQNRQYASPRLVHQEAGVVTRAVRDYLRDDIAEIWVDNENAYNEAANFISAVMPKQLDKLRKYTDYEPMFARFGIEKQIETAYQREVRLPSGGSIVIDQTEAMVAIDINSAKSTKGSDVAETAYHTNLEAADEIARQLRLRDMGGLVVIDFIDMYEHKHQKDVEKRLVDATKYDRARVQFGDISKFGLMEMSRQRLRPSLEESTGYKCPRCHGNGMIRDLRSLSLSIMRQIERIALKERQGEVQAEVPTDIAAFLLNEKRDSLVYLEQDSGTRITILPHAHLESPNFHLHFNSDGFAPSSYERITDSQLQETTDRGYEVNWQTNDSERPEQQPTRKPRHNDAQKQKHNKNKQQRPPAKQTHAQNQQAANPSANRNTQNHNQGQQQNQSQNQPHAVAWLSNLFAPTPQAQVAGSISSQDAAQAIEAIVNTGGQSLGAFGQVDVSALASTQPSSNQSGNQTRQANQQASQTTNNSGMSNQTSSTSADTNTDTDDKDDYKRKPRKPKHDKGRKKERRHDKKYHKKRDDDKTDQGNTGDDYQNKPKREANSKRESRGDFPRNDTLTNQGDATEKNNKRSQKPTEANKQQNRGNEPATNAKQKPATKSVKVDDNSVNLHVSRVDEPVDEPSVIHLSLDDSKPKPKPKPKADGKNKADAKSEPKSTHMKVEAAQKSKEANKAKKDEGLDNTAKNEATKEAILPKLAESATNNTQTSSIDTAKQDPENGKDVHHIAAHTYGRASNDPRTVKENLANAMQVKQEKATQERSTPEAQIQAKRSANRITGSVGDFIRATLDNPMERLEQHGVIVCFIDAVNQFTETNKVSDLEVQASDTDAGSDVVDTSHFDFSNFNFSNYGYDALTPEYLAGFGSMTKAVGQHDVIQGKTTVEAVSVGKRASNDPRGQHPDYVEVNNAPEPNNELVVELSSKSSPESSLASNSELTPADNTEDNTDNQHQLSEESIVHDVEITVQASDGQDSQAVVDTEGVQTVQDVETFEIVANEEAVIETTQEGNAVAELEDNVTELQKAEMQTEIQDDTAEERTKTTIAKYKNMIESVAEQLLPQSASLLIPTAKIPKARTRKAKSEHKKPSKAEESQDDAEE